jgi:heterodisulfide reductase subunit A
MLEPLMDEVLHHPQIEVLTYSEVEEVLGYFGNFTARIRRKARHVDPEGCYGCRTCHDACPVVVPNLADGGLRERKALYIPYEGALPNATLVDEASCLHFNGGECDACVAACPFAAIDLGGADEVVERRVGAVILATGAEPEAIDDDTRAAGVIDGMTLERLLNSAGPTGGEVRLPGGDSPRSIAFVHCADAFGVAPVEACSKLCCMSIAKYIQQLHELLPDCRIHQLMWERCVGGKEYREFANKAERLPGLQLHRLHPGDRVEGIHGTDDGPVITYVEGGETTELAVDLAVICPPLEGAGDVERIADGLRIVLDRERFVVEEHERLRPFRTRIEGVYVAGCARGPGDIQESAAQGAAAAGSALSALVPGRKLKIEAIVAEVREELCGGCHTCVITCPYRAVTFDEERRVGAVNELLCRGCGSCVAACPNGAIVQRNFTDEQLDAEISAHML